MRKVKFAVIVASFFLPMLITCAPVVFSGELSNSSLNAILQCEGCSRQDDAVTLSDFIEYIRFLSPDVKAVESEKKVLLTFGKSKLMFNSYTVGESASSTMPAIIALVPEGYMEDGLFVGAVASKEFAAQKIGLILSEAEMRMMEQGVETPAAKRNHLKEAELLEQNKQEQLQADQEIINRNNLQTQLIERIKSYQVWAAKGNRSAKSTGHTLWEVFLALKRQYPNAQVFARSTDAQTILMSLGGSYFTVVDNSQQSRLEVNDADAGKFIWSLLEQG